MLRLRQTTGPGWIGAVLGDFDTFLEDHAANERKAAVSALVLASHHPRRVELTHAMLAVAEEELGHFRQVWELLVARGRSLGPDAPDPYIARFFKALRKTDHAEYLLDRLLAFAIVEARGCERFGLVAEALPAGALADLYRELAGSEARHHALYLRLARGYFDAALVERRLDELLAAESEVVRALPPRAALH